MAFSFATADKPKHGSHLKATSQADTSKFITIKGTLSSVNLLECSATIRSKKLENKVLIPNTAVIKINGKQGSINDIHSGLTATVYCSRASGKLTVLTISLFDKKPPKSQSTH